MPLASASYGTGSDLQRAIQAATAITQGLTGGNIGQALSGGSAPYLAHEISKYLPADQSLGANLMAHAVLGAVVGHFSGNATVGAISAFTAEAAAPAIIKAMGWDKDSFTEKQKQTVSTLATLAAGLAGGLVGDSSSSAVAGAQAGKNAVDNNSMSGLVPPRVQQDASLAFDPNQQGKSAEEISEAIDASHLGPSWGTEYKVKPNGKVEVSGGVGFALKGETVINNDYFSISTGYTKEFGVKAGASLGIDFGPYAPGIFGDLSRDYSGSIGFGPGSVGTSVGKDGIGFSFSVGPTIGFTGSVTGSHADKIELNGDSTKEIYHHDFK
ncbi:polymorphic toxin type 25 domain-containing protein [Yersinia rohdei]|uniref:polymorphic toxin type 25 domain-containing protein n=1 Tax=Yersinia rohdei TaxID=29485 RepID=UPI0006D3E2B2|nr:polymorphic toxin type 25 domain-containing protein [Yersinia rohdei]